MNENLEIINSFEDKQRIKNTVKISVNKLWKELIVDDITISDDDVRRMKKYQKKDILENNKTKKQNP